ncbi:MAG: DUF1761 domain-containing protein [Cyclobacteriaceae bacterium]
MNELRINHLAVLVSVIWMFVLGFLWYGPIMGEPWMEMVGLTLEEIEASPPGAGIWISNVISSAAPIYLLAWLFVQMNVKSGIKGLAIGFLVGFVFFHLPGMTGGMFSKEPYMLAWLEGGFQIIGWSVGGLILGSWTKAK